MASCCCCVVQVSNWFINARVRLWKPMVEEMYLEDQKEGGQGEGDKEEEAVGHEDRKPTEDQLMMRTDSECLSSIINTSSSRNHISTRGGGDEMQFDFSSYASASHHHPGPSGSSGGVSLTLGLQQHGGGGVTLAFTPAAGEGGMFYTRDEEMEECERVDQYSSMFDGESQNLHLMGAQLLHDLAG